MLVISRQNNDDDVEPTANATKTRSPAKQNDNDVDNIMEILCKRWNWNGEMMATEKFAHVSLQQLVAWAKKVHGVTCNSPKQRTVVIKKVADTINPEYRIERVVAYDVKERKRWVKVHYEHWGDDVDLWQDMDELGKFIEVYLLAGFDDAVEAFHKYDLDEDSDHSDHSDASSEEL